MKYKPADHALTVRQVVAAWLTCLGIVLCVLGAPSLWTPLSAVISVADARAHAMTRTLLSGHNVPCPTGCSAKNDRVAAVASCASPAAGRSRV
jgi:hypothetical protein